MAALHPLLDLQRLPVPPSAAWDTVRASALGALSNACVGQESAPEALAKAGAAAVLLGMLDEGAGDMPFEVRSRAALLLGRLSGLPSTAAALCDPAVVARVTAWLAEALQAGKGGDAAAQYQDGLVRILAAAASATPAATTALHAAGGAATLSAFIAAALPSLRPSAGLRSRAPAVGNACKALIGLADASPEDAAAGLPPRPDALLAAGACEVLVEALKCAGDDNVPVRKNAAVALARLARHPAAHARIRDLRGMEILVQVSSQLL